MHKQHNKAECVTIEDCSWEDTAVCPMGRTTGNTHSLPRNGEEEGNHRIELVWLLISHIHTDGIEKHGEHRVARPLDKCHAAR